MKYISDSVHDGELVRSQLAAGDVLITITGRVGSASVVHDEHLPANINQHIARLRIDTDRCRPQFLCEWLNCAAGLELSSRFVSGATRVALDYSAVRSIPVPLPNSLHTQDKLLAVLDTARAERKTKLAEADALLAGTNDFVLDLLSITPTPKVRRRVYAVRVGQLLAQGRLNSDYYNPERMLVLPELSDAAERLTVRSLAEVVSFERDQIGAPSDNYLSLAHVQSHTGELTTVTDIAMGKCLAFQTDDVLFSRLRPYLNKAYRAEMEGCCSTEFHVLRVKNNQALLPEYLAAVIRSPLVLTQTIHMMTGNTHPRLTNEGVANLKIPIPTMEIQEAISSEISRRRIEVRCLRIEAETAWQESKQWFEEQLLGKPTGS